MEIVINNLRGLVTVASLALFLGIVWWAWSKRRSDDFNEAANLPFQQD